MKTPQVILESLSANDDLGGCSVSLRSNADICHRGISTTHQVGDSSLGRLTPGNIHM